jgi:hypothetical protein
MGLGRGLLILIAIVLLLAVGLPILLWKAVTGLVKLVAILVLLVLVLGLILGAMRRPAAPAGRGPRHA